MLPKPTPGFDNKHPRWQDIDWFGALLIKGVDSRTVHFGQRCIQGRASIFIRLNKVTARRKASRV